MVRLWSENRTAWRASSGNLLSSGGYSDPCHRGVQLIDNLPANGVVTVKEIWIRVEAHRTLQLHQIFLARKTRWQRLRMIRTGRIARKRQPGWERIPTWSPARAVKTEEVDLDSQIVTVALWVIVGADLILLPGAYLVSRLPRRTPRTSRKILKEEKSPCFFNERCYNKNQR